MKPSTQPETYLVTGAMGCIGAWTIHHLLRQGHQVVAFDLSRQTGRLELLLDPSELEKIVFEQGDLTDFEQVKGVFERHPLQRVIHLAALQVPFCRADPLLGSRVNVVGTVNIFEAARQTGIEHLSYASSAAVYGPPESNRPVKESAPLDPRTIYGVYKVANEGTAKVYWLDHSISSVAFRPHTVYGLGRDQGMTSDSTKAMLAAAAGTPFTLQYGNAFQLQLASDVALQFIEGSRHPARGSFVFNLPGEAPPMTEFLGMIQSLVPNARIDFVDRKLPIAECTDSSALESHFAQVYRTPLLEGMKTTIHSFRELIESGRLSVPAS